MADDRILDRIRKLLAQAEHPHTSEQEAEVFSGRAEALMHKYAIDQAMVQSKSGTDETIEVREIKVTAPYAKEKSLLASSVARAFGAEAVMFNSGGWGRGGYVKVVGWTSDLEQVEVLFTSLLIQAARDVMRQRVPFGEDKAAYRSSWMLGFRSGAGNRLARLRKQATAEANEATGNGAEMVLVSRHAQIEKRFAEEFPTTHTVKVRSSGSGYRAGYESGSTADVGNRRVDQDQSRRGSLSA